MPPSPLQAGRGGCCRWPGERGVGRVNPQEQWPEEGDAACRLKGTLDPPWVPERAGGSPWRGTHPLSVLWSAEDSQWGLTEGIRGEQLRGKTRFLMVIGSGCLGDRTQGGRHGEGPPCSWGGCTAKPLGVVRTPHTHHFYSSSSDLRGLLPLQKWRGVPKGDCLEGHPIRLA